MTQKQKKVLKLSLDIPGTELKKGMEYEIMSEDKDNYHLWGETEDGGGVFTFPKVIRVQTGVICSPTNHAEIRAKALADKKKIDEAVKVIEGWTK